MKEQRQWGKDKGRYYVYCAFFVKEALEPCLILGWHRPHWLAENMVF